MSRTNGQNTVIINSEAESYKFATYTSEAAVEKGLDREACSVVP